MAVNQNTINMPIKDLKDPTKPDRRAKFIRTDAEWRDLIWNAEREAIDDFRKELFYGATTAMGRLVSEINTGRIPVKLLGQAAGIMADKYKMFSEMKNGKDESEVKDPMILIQNIQFTLKTIRDRPENKRYIPGIQSKWLVGAASTEETDEE